MAVSSEIFLPSGGGRWSRQIRIYQEGHCYLRDIGERHELLAS
ncbi:uncharacterized protein RCO7_15069 [Rhynchosporium graminicola]|uniref:Uncharacterized protein n=2 Tax=Rhynchosporium TaxID=38037 RepID=A0A1E1MTU1_RHYSE|nr:uncharacterized protein RCO7_15069 [Rhynchosporium commune]CZT52479.1 uncharacterized protein RSE6_13819 [Rhynchosporium secalis]